ncbi:hypothetical protein TcBrA4_0099010 [Trypanosoma cruzi]|nr:hypothetical protein TcBrA4_0099010 [Trypanosoma cruzi]
MSWYPLGRPWAQPSFLDYRSQASLFAGSFHAGSEHDDERCVLLDSGMVWLSATVLAALLAYETWGSFSGAAMTAGLFAILPAHLMRSMAGEYDNECIAMARCCSHSTCGALVAQCRLMAHWCAYGLAYGYMVSTWGGFIFVLNMVALHAAVCVFADWMPQVRCQSAVGVLPVLCGGHGRLRRVCRPWVDPIQVLGAVDGVAGFIFMWALHFSEILRRRADVPICSTKATADPCTGIHDHLRSACAGCSASGTTGILRAPLLPRPCLVCAAHPTATLL